MEIGAVHQYFNDGMQWKHKSRNGDTSKIVGYSGINCDKSSTDIYRGYSNGIIGGLDQA